MIENWVANIERLRRTGMRVFLFVGGSFRPATKKHPTHFQWGLDLENVLAKDVEYPRCLDNPEQRVFDDMLRCRP
ncbi:hypothetical protein TNCV_3079641 [Trichonephila clavipes]|nr:hypothetical protein TNCV_3079641 [Trichonephila clavipes]